MADFQISSSQQLTAANAAEVDVQIATAHKYPRNVAQCLQSIEFLACNDPETAASCMYHLKRGDGDIEGLSVRMAEIIASQWRNLRVAARVVSNDGRFVTVEAVAHDLETNVAVCTQTQRRITKSNGQTYSDDMQMVTTNAALAIARRNAVLQVVPKAVTAPIIARVKAAISGKAKAEHSPEVVAKMVAYLGEQGVSVAQMLAYLERPSLDAVTADDVLTLRAVANAVKEGSTSWEEEFGKVVADSSAQSMAEKAKAAMAAKKAVNTAPPTQPTPQPAAAPAQPQTIGEIVASGGTGAAAPKQERKSLL